MLAKGVGAQSNELPTSEATIRRERQPGDLMISQEQKESTRELFKAAPIHSNLICPSISFVTKRCLSGSYSCQGGSIQPLFRPAFEQYLFSHPNLPNKTYCRCSSLGHSLPKAYHCHLFITGEATTMSHSRRQIAVRYLVPSP